MYHLEYPEEWDETKSTNSEKSVQIKENLDFRKEFNKLRAEIKQMLGTMNEDGSKNYMV